MNNSGNDYHYNLNISNAQLEKMTEVLAERFGVHYNKSEESAALQAQREQIIEKLEGLKVEESGHDKVLRVRYNHAIDQAIKAVGESSGKEEE